MTDQETSPPREPAATAGPGHMSDRDFADFPLSAEVLQGLAEMGYRTATTVQSSTIEAALAGKDLLVRAKTGTGKTAAFGIPLVERIADGEKRTRAIVLSPTRELAVQIAEECSAIAKHRDLSIAVLVGGMPIGPQEKALRNGAAIVVGTPGRTLDHIRRRNLDLGAVATATLDEADEMVSMGFFEDVSAILDACGDERQVLLFSATVDERTGKIVGKYLRDPEEIFVSTDTDLPEGITHVMYETSPGMHKIRSLLYLIDLEDPESAIVFCNTREDAATVAAFLDRQGIDVQLLSGELPQSQRNKAMARVRHGEVRYLVATDVAARGIDISDLSHVINYSLPEDPAIYLHRTGRTGRLGKEGTAISLVGGTGLGTLKVLENEHEIQFVAKEFPDEETVVRMRVERQARAIRSAMGTMVFEAYLPTVRELKAREDGDALLAAALRAFFQWNRTRLAASRGGGRTRAQMQEDSRPRRDRGSRRDRGPKPDRKRKPRKRRDKPEVAVDDLDALLVADDEPSRPKDKPTKGRRDDEAGQTRKGRQKRRRRRKKGKGDDRRQAAGADQAGDLDLDGLLVVEEPKDRGPLPDDLDSLLSMD